VDGDDIAMLDAEIMSNHTVHTCTTIIQFVISENDENSILALFALHKNSIATEELQCLHGIIGERNNGVVIVDSICDPVATLSAKDFGNDESGRFLH
jgi:hypothetical protein